MILVVSPVGIVLTRGCSSGWHRISPLPQRVSSTPTLLCWGGGIRSPVLSRGLQVGGCVHPGNCRVHPSGCPSVRPVRVVHVRGDPPSAFIARPYLRFPGSDPASARGLNGVSLYSPGLEESRDALTYLLGNIDIVFESYEQCLDELDAWRRYFHSGH